jgi:hypothetical protein
LVRWVEVVLSGSIRKQEGGLKTESLKVGWNKGGGFLEINLNRKSKGREICRGTDSSKTGKGCQERGEDCRQSGGEFHRPARKLEPKRPVKRIDKQEGARLKRSLHKDPKYQP